MQEDLLTSGLVYLVNAVRRYVGDRAKGPQRREREQLREDLAEFDTTLVHNLLDLLEKHRASVGRRLMEILALAVVDDVAALIAQAKKEYGTGDWGPARIQLATDITELITLAHWKSASLFGDFLEHFQAEKVEAAVNAVQFEGATHPLDDKLVTDIKGPREAAFQVLGQVVGITLRAARYRNCKVKYRWRFPEGDVVNTNDDFDTEGAIRYLRRTTGAPKKKAKSKRSPSHAKAKESRRPRRS